MRLIFCAKGGGTGRMAIELRCGPAVVNVDDWDVVAETSKGITRDTFLEQVEPGQAVALLDRNCVTEPWRNIFAVLGARGEVYIFDGKTGAPIDEPEAGVPKGITPLQGEEGTFLNDWKFGYYSVALEVVAETGPPPVQEPAAEAEDVVNYVIDERCVKGARMAIAFDNVWEGCIVDEVIADPLALLLAFDDGDLAVRTSEQIEQDIKHECLKFLSAETKGIVKSNEGVPAAVRAARGLKLGRSAEPRTVGVLVGATKYCIAGDNIYQSFFVDSDAFKDNTGITRRGDAPSAQDRWGFRTFRRGDVVAYQHVSDGEECNAHVFGVTWPEADAGRKYLVLQEAATGLFFASSYNDWRRVHKIQGAEPDDNDTAVCTTSAAAEKMVDDWESSEKLAHLDTAKKLANHTRLLPPHLKAQRAEAARVAKEAELEVKKERKRKLRAEQLQGLKDLQNEELAAAKAAGKGKGKGKGRGAHGRGRGKNKGDTVDVVDDDGGGDDDDDESLAARVRGRQTAAATAATEAKRARDETQRERAAHTAEVRELQRQLAAAQAGQPQLPPQTAMPLQQLLPGTPQPAAALPKREQPAVGAVAQPGLPPGWRVAKDDAGSSYYYNKTLGISTYERPGADSPPLPPPPSSNKPIPTSVAEQRSFSRSTADAYEVEQRRNRIAHIKGYLPHSIDRSEVAALHGELAVLQREEHLYREQQRLF